MAPEPAGMQHSGDVNVIGYPSWSAVGLVIRQVRCNTETREASILARVDRLGPRRVCTAQKDDRDLSFGPSVLRLHRLGTPQADVSEGRRTQMEHLGDLYAESGQTLRGSFSAVSKPNFASKYSLESSRRDLHNALLCTVLESTIENWGKKNLAKTTPKR